MMLHVIVVEFVDEIVFPNGKTYILKEDEDGRLGKSVTKKCDLGVDYLCFCLLTSYLYTLLLIVTLCQ